MKHYFNTAMWNLGWPCLNWWNPRKCYCKRSARASMQRNVDLIILVKNIITWELTFLVRIYWKDISSCLSVWWYLCILQHLIHTPQCDCPALKSWHQLQQGRSHSLNSFVVALFLVDLQYFADLQYFTDQQFLLLQLVPPIYAPCDSDFCSYACNQWHWQYCFHFLKKYINEPWKILIWARWTIGTGTSITDWEHKFLVDSEHCQ